MPKTQNSRNREVFYLEKKKEALKAYKQTGDMKIAANRIAMSERKTSKLLRDALEEDIRSIVSAATTDEWKHAIESEYNELYLSLKQLHKQVKEIMDIERDGIDTKQTDTLLKTIKETRKTLQALDDHHQKWGNAQSVTHDFSWNMEEMMESPQMENFINIMMDIQRKPISVTCPECGHDFYVESLTPSEINEMINLRMKGEEVKNVVDATIIRDVDVIDDD